MATALPDRLFSASRPDPHALKPTMSETVPPATSPVEYDARREHRVPVSASAMVVSNQTELQPLTIADLSRHGCRLEGDCTALRPGQFITIKIDTFDRLAAIVRWADEGRAGMEFTRALPQHMFEFHTRDLSGE